ncbi:MAG: hypothetical protein R3F59_27900 [Myxococcota bacterium]
MNGALRWAAALLLAALGPSCTKVPIQDIGAFFSLADATWFESEQTLFVFYEVHAEQGLNDLSAIEIRYETDGERRDWTPLSALPSVHDHVPVGCNGQAPSPTDRCGSWSLRVEQEPRDVAIRLRYHPDGELALQNETVYNVVRAGAPHVSRSALVYGVFDEANEHVQWRLRRQFPTLRNERVTALGLRRTFLVDEERYGSASPATAGNPYAYGVPCPDDFVPLDFGPLQTTERAAFDYQTLPVEASDASLVCARATVADGTGTFTTTAVAQKNAEVRPAFPVLRSPIHEATRLPFFLGPCRREISAVHDDMLRQRLMMGDVERTCTDTWAQPGFVEGLVVTLRDAVEAQRPLGNDMVLTIALSEDDPGTSLALEQALAQVLPDERLRGSPRLVGAFVLDSEAWAPGPTVSPVALWCPAVATAGGVASSCAVQPDVPDIALGPFSFGTIPILPTREDYVDFVQTYSEAQAGQVRSLSLLTPEFSATASHVALDDYGVATFLNGEHISAAPSDAFSYCTGDAPPIFVFRAPSMTGLEPFDEGMIAACDDAGLPDACSAAQLGLVPLEFLPDWHALFAEDEYDLGVFWEFPFLVRMEYEVVTAGSLSAFGFSVPFGFHDTGESYYGTAIWTQSELPLDTTLLQCTRFCDHPTFDSAGVYHPQVSFRSGYAHNCYVPAYPALGDGGFPRDP